MSPDLPPYTSNVEVYLHFVTSVPTDINLFKGLPHGFRRYGTLTEAARWDKVMEDGIRWAIKKPSPSYEFNVKLE